MNGQTVRAAALAVVVSVCASTAIVATADKRSLRAPPSGVTSTFSTSTFEKAMKAKKTNWFHKKLRCDKASFLRIYKEVEASMDRLPAANSKTFLVKRVALTMHYLAVGSTMDQAASVMGVSRPRALDYINEILEVLVKMAKRNVVMPSPEELSAVEKVFEAIASFPGVVGAIDGTLIKIPRPRDFEGWYCRKGFPAVNVQAIVDHRGAFSSLSIRAGVNNDQSLWNGSGVQKRLASFIPLGKHLLGDAGYKLWGHLLTPFAEHEAAEDHRKRAYNYRHSRTRITVECAFGRLKNRFRIIMLGDTYQVSPHDPLRLEPRPRVDEDFADPEQPLSHDQGIVKRNDIADVFVGLF